MKITDPKLLQLELLESAKTLLGLYKSAGAGHIGSSLSCLQILVDLAFRRMDSSDRMILSKGHAAAALYTVLARSGRIPPVDLQSFYKEGTHLAAHPSCSGTYRDIPFGTGSLGHGLSLATGFAFSQRYTGKDYRVYCVLSDGDCNEGSTWEAALFAAHHKLSNLTVIIDANGLQGFGQTKDVMDLEPLENKWKSFGFKTSVIADGNDLNKIDRAFAAVSAGDGPTCFIARTQKGFGVSYMQNQMEWHYLPMNDSQYQQALKDVAERMVGSRA